MDFSDWISHHAETTPTRPAIIFEGGSISYGELAAWINTFVQVLGAGLGIKPGDRVAYLGLNSPEFVALLFACARVGAVALPLNWRLAAAEHVQILQHAQPLVLFVEDEFKQQVDGVRDQLAVDELICFGEAGDGWLGFQQLKLAALQKPAFQRPADLSEEDGLLLCYTSGTTGVPKGALLSKNALYYNALNSTHMHDMGPEDTVLAMLPMFHVGGINVQSIPAWFNGATVVLLKRFEVDLFYRSIARHPVTLTVAVPTMMLAIMADPRWTDTRPGSLRSITTGSTIVPASMVSTVCDWGVPMVQIYGSTETCPIAAYTLPDQARTHPASTGKTAIHSEIRLIDEQGQPVDTGQKGEILVRGPHVMNEYWGDDEATREAFTGRWFHTGDVGHFDEEGFLYVDGRIKDMIISGGENIYPALVENVLSTMDGIREIALVGLPDDYWGEIAVAVVVVRAGSEIDGGQIRDFSEDRISHYSLPREIFIVDELPKNSMGKVLKDEVCELAMNLQVQQRAQQQKHQPEQQEQRKEQREN
jgi:fatty-acyl-CoA synthase